MTAVPLNEIEQQPLAEFTEKAYLDYSMAVILDRALPHLADGLKPVQRRIIYAMSELGLRATAKHKKSARTVGDVLGKFHPHGDSACYEAMVLMAQSFSYRYPFVDGQGNWGSQDDPKSFAAMRYTEARLSPYAQILLDELPFGTVDWLPNFDGTLEEPALLPAQLPNVLLNGAMGIAVGMATDIPPHNLQEVAGACIHLLDNPTADLREIAQFIKGPDFPTAAEIITPESELRAIYKNGHGSFRMRATYEKEEEDIVITALPHQVSGAKVLEQIAEQMNAKKLPMVSDLRDESDHENPVRLVITPRSNRVDTDEVMTHLFATTDLERSYRVNLNVIGLDGKPQVKNLLRLLQEWLEFRMRTVTRRLQHRLQQVDARMHILDGLLIAFLNLDKVIAIIRKEEDPKTKLIQKFALSETQADAILDLKLRHLAKLEEIKIQEEQAALSKESAELNATLASKTKLRNLIKKELKTCIERHGDARRSPLVKRKEAQALREEDVRANDPVTIVLSKQGWIRAGKGHELDPTTLNYKAGDEYFMHALGRTNEPALVLDSTGRSYSLPTHKLSSARGQGEPLTLYLKPPTGARFVSLLTGKAEAYAVLAVDAGYGFVTTLENLHCKNRSGKAILKMSEGSQVLPPVLVDTLEQQWVAVVTDTGHLLIFSLKDMPLLERGKGNKMINIPTAQFKKGEERCVGLVILAPKDSLILCAGKQELVLSPKEWAGYRGAMAARGKKVPVKKQMTAIKIKAGS